MKLEIGKQYKTQAGHRAVCVGKTKHLFSVWHVLPDGNNCIKLTHYSDGEQSIGPGNNTPDFDIVSGWTEPKKGAIWLNVYGFSDDETIQSTHDNRKAADDCAKSPYWNFRQRLACVRVEWEEGQGLDDA